MTCKGMWTDDRDASQIFVLATLDYRDFYYLLNVHCSVSIRLDFMDFFHACHSA